MTVASLTRTVALDACAVGVCLRHPRCRIPNVAVDGLSFFNKSMVPRYLFNGLVHP